MGVVDALIVEFDRGLRTLVGPVRAGRPSPGTTCPDGNLSEDERRHVVGLMRVNHCGEICAQALYQGQAAVEADPGLKLELHRAADEELDHLAWTEQRLGELGGRKSWLSPFWYGAALLTGILAGRAGSGWNLGFLVETERQVADHLDAHLARLPAADFRSRVILEQMRQDEVRHGRRAQERGGRPLPAPIRETMRAVSRAMTRSAYWI